jgi:transcriptional regulator with XRE-family HTH domain
MIRGLPSQDESLGARIRRLRRERGVSLAKVGRGDFTRAFLSQVELGRAQPSLRVLRVIADRLGTHVDYLLEGRSPELDRELALERARVLLLRGEPKRALISLRGLDDAAWPLSTDARLCEAEALAQLGQQERARKLLDAERMVISKRRDHHRMDRWRALSEGRRFSYGDGDARSAAEAHLQVAERNTRSGDVRGALDHYRAARALLEA